VKKWVYFSASEGKNSNSNSEKKDISCRESMLLGAWLFFRYLFRINSNTVVFIYIANLFLKLYGQERLNEICQRDIWFKTRNGWKLISSEALDKPENPVVQ
jgi:hypothetical protein